VNGSTLAALALGTAPGGDAILAWVSSAGGQKGDLLTQSVAATGEAEGPAVSLGGVLLDTEQSLRVVASAQGGMVIYDNQVPNQGRQVFAIPIHCAE
jgi:hypothetical protein